MGMLERGCMLLFSSTRTEFLEDFLRRLPLAAGGLIASSTLCWGYSGRDRIWMSFFMNNIAARYLI